MKNLLERINQMHYKYYTIFDKTENPNGTHTVTFPNIIAFLVSYRVLLETPDFSRT